MGAALGTMVANLSSHKRGWDDRWEEFSDIAVEGKRYHDELLRLIDEDTDAFNAIMAAFGLPRGSEAEQQARTAAIEDATKGAIEVPLRVMKTALESMTVIRRVAENGMSSSVSDAGVAALAARSAVLGAFLNVKINCSDVADQVFVQRVMEEGAAMQERALAAEQDILAIVDGKLAG